MGCRWLDVSFFPFEPKMKTNFLFGKVWVCLRSIDLYSESKLKYFSRHLKNPVSKFFFGFFASSVFLSRHYHRIAPMTNSLNKKYLVQWPTFHNAQIWTNMSCIRNPNHLPSLNHAGLIYLIYLTPVFVCHWHAYRYGLASVICYIYLDDCGSIDHLSL